MCFLKVWTLTSFTYYQGITVSESNLKPNVWISFCLVTWKNCGAPLVIFIYDEKLDKKKSYILHWESLAALWCHRCWEHNLGHDIELRYWFLGTFYGTRGLRIGRWLPSQSNIIVSFEGSFTHQALKSMHFQLKNGVYAKGHISYKNAWNLMVK